VRWRGYGAEHDEWIRRSELVRTAPDVVAQFDALQGGHTDYLARVALSQLWASRPIAEYGNAPCATAA
jgi:hypothetical protein